MSLDWNAFTPATSLIGGLLIGAAATLYVLGVARIAGIAGILATVLRRPGAGRGRERAVALAFLVGLALAPWLWRLVAPLPVPRIEAGTLGLIGAGLLVGVGVRLGNGCTSGHGVCGLSRFSLRSLVNVITFIGAGIATVAAMRSF
jgi:hypothetical protein